MKFCQKCGTQHEDGASFCSKCGTPFQTTATTQPIQQTNTYQTVKTKSKRKLPLWKKILIGIGVFLLVGIIGSMGGEDTGDTTTEKTTSSAETTKSTNKNVDTLIEATGYNEDVCEKIYNQLKECGYEKIGDLTEVGTEEDTKSYKVTGSYLGSGMMIVSKNGLFYFSWGSDTLYDAEKPDTVKNINDYAVLTEDRANYYLPTEDAIKNLLKSPSTAKFPAWYKGWNLSTENGIVTVSSYVDAQNSFGATLRSTFTAQYRISDGHGIYLEFDGQVYLDER